MVIDATFWVAISFVIFIGGLIYLKVPQKINEQMNNMISVIKNEIEEAEKLKNETKKLLNDSQLKIENAHKESEKIINAAKTESEKIIIEMNEKFFQSSENKKKITEQKIVQIKNDAIKDIKDASVKIAIESTSKIIQTSIDKSKLDVFFKRNLEQIKNSLKKTTRA
jgi:F-type H+-transporting ATPase subunit b